MGSVSLILMGGLVAVFVLTYIVDAMIEKASGPLPIDTRNTIYQHEASTLMLWRVPDAIGIGLMLLGILKARGMLGGGAPWGIPAMTFGLLLVCAANTLRAWMRKRTYARFAPGSDAARTAVVAAMLITVAEIGLAGATLYFTQNQVLALVGTPAKTSTAGGKTPPVNTGTELRPRNGLWIGEDEALERVKGRGAEYLKALREQSHIRTEVQGGKTMYRSDDFDAMLEFPAYEELGLKKPKQ
jgi:hypothetical protein